MVTRDAALDMDTMMDLSGLPQFTVDTVHVEPGGDAIVVGRLSHLRGVRNESGWLHRRPGPSIVGTLDRMPSAAGEAVAFRTPDAALAPELRAGAVFPWVDWYWQPYHVDMILDGEWERRRFAPGPARYFRLNGVTGWQPDDGPLPDGAEDLGVRAGGWDHEHCELCRATIGAGGAAEGRVTPHDLWLCEPCFHRYAEPRDLGFMTEE